MTQLLDTSLLVANVASVGHLGSLELAAVQLSAATLSSLGRGVFLGLHSGLDTLLTQGWTSSSPQQIGLHAQRQIVLDFLILVPQLVLFFNAEPVLRLFGQSTEVSGLAGKVLKIHCLHLPFMACTDVCNRWLAAQGRVRPATYIMTGRHFAYLREFLASMFAIEQNHIL